MNPSRRPARLRARLRAVAALGSCLTLLACSVLSGRTVSDPTSTGRPAGPSARPGPNADYANFDYPQTIADVLAQAKANVETVFTFDYRDLPKYVNAGVKVTTGDYTGKYRTSLQGAAAKSLRAGEVVQFPSVDLIGIVNLSADRKSAQVWAHLKITTSSSRTRTPTEKTNAAVADLKLVNHAWLISSLKSASNRATGAVPAKPGLRAATTFAHAAILDIYGLSRDHFDKQYDKLMGESSPDMQTSLRNVRSQLQQRLQDGSYDLASAVVGFAVVKADLSMCRFMIGIEEFRLGRQGVKFGPYQHTLDVSVANSGGKWVLSDVTTLP